MNMEEYERAGQAVYADLALIIADILRTEIEADASFGLQQVVERAKQPSSLNKKLLERGIAGTTTLEDDIKDLAGCRVIFYTNSDVARFINSGIIHEKFEVVEVRLHHPRREVEDASELYISNHYIVMLSPDLIALPKYAHLAGKRCEIQIQTILNHAWAEMAHDTIYKAPALDGFGTEALDGIKNRMQRVARKYLVPAGYEFQKIASDFERLVQGKELFDGDALEEVVEAADNNVRAEALEKFSEYIIPFYDDPKPLYPEIVDRLIEAARRSRSTPPIPVETAYETYTGKTYSDILDGITEILSNYRYLDVEVTFNAACTLYSWCDEVDQRDKMLELASRLAKHQMEVWRDYGPAVQAILVNRIEAFGEDELRGLEPILTVMLTEILGTEIHGTTSSSNSMTIHRGAVTVSEELRTIRNKAIYILKSQFTLAKQEKRRGVLLDALQAATRQPSGVDYSNSLAHLVMENTITIVNFMTEIAPILSFELLQKSEHRVHRYRWKYSDLPKTMRDEPRLIEGRQSIEDASLAFRDVTNGNTDFEIYKTLVGFNSVFLPAWGDKSFDRKRKEEYRGEKVEEFISSITEKNAKEWYERINRCARTESNDLATFPIFGKFLERLGEEKPVIVLTLIARIEAPLAKFLPSILLGLMRSAEHRQVVVQIDIWLGAGEQISHVAWYLRFAETFDEELLRRTLNSAIEKNNQHAMRCVLLAAVDQFDDHPGTLIENIFLPSLRYFETSADFSWIETSWFSWHEKSIIRALNEDQARFLLRSLVPFLDIDSNVESIATSIAEQWLSLVVNFIGERQTFATTGEAPRGYDAIPFSVHELKEPLFAAPDILLDGARTWFDNDPQYFVYNGGRLIASVFPNLENGLEERLAILIDGGDDDLAFLLAVLSAYEGQSFIYELIRMAVANLTPDSSLWGKAKSALNQTGVMSGEYGFAILYTERKAWISPWLEDPHETVRIFAAEEIRHLEVMVASETRSADSSIALRRLEYGEEPESDEDG